MADPIEIPYNRWKSKIKGYLVTVTGVHYQQGQKQSVTYVTFTDGKQSWIWSAKTFLQHFDPVGPKLRRKTVWQWILGKDLF